jgi:hypothetical protein
MEGILARRSGSNTSKNSEGKSRKENPIGEKGAVPENNIPENKSGR